MRSQAIFRNPLLDQKRISLGGDNDLALYVQAWACPPTNLPPKQGAIWMVVITALFAWKISHWCGLLWITERFCALQKFLCDNYTCCGEYVRTWDDGWFFSDFTRTVYHHGHANDAYHLSLSGSLALILIYCPPLRDTVERESLLQLMWHIGRLVKQVSSGVIISISSSSSSSSIHSNCSDCSFAGVEKAGFQMCMPEHFLSL